MVGRHRLRQVRRDERGIVLPLVAILLVSLLGMVAMSIDIGKLALNRRQLQNAADAGALAGAVRLPGDSAQAVADGVAWAGNNGVVSPDLASVTLSKTDSSWDWAYDTITVTTTRNVKYSFAQVLGFSDKNVTGTARAQVFRVVGADTEGGALFPYAVWGGNKNGPADVSPGKSVTYRTNNYMQANVQTIPADAGNKACQHNSIFNCNWNVGSNAFKGYFHWKNRYVYLDWDSKQSEDQGGNAFGTEPVSALVKDQQAHTPVWLPVVRYADDAGQDLHFIIVTFVCVDLDPIDTSGSADWTGTVLDASTNIGCHKSFGLTSGGEAPPSGVVTQFTFHMTQ